MPTAKLSELLSTVNTALLLQMDGSQRFPLVMLKTLSQQMWILSTVCPAMPKILSCTSHSNDSFVSAQQTIKPKKEIKNTVIDDCSLGN